MLDGTVNILEQVTNGQVILEKLRIIKLRFDSQSFRQSGHTVWIQGVLFGKF